ncbi:MAG: HAMP domain-containing histidine kinase [Bacteroidales bacterium]|nr:HAMP domain-containing histidine kinase [Bacteroidales bacterium]
MKNRVLKWFIFLGILAIMSNLGLQLYLLRSAYKEGQNKFTQAVQLALIEAIGKMTGWKSAGNSEFGPVKKISSDYFIVDVNDHINAGVLEFYLIRELRNYGIDADFEYAIYDCETDQMVYGNYVRQSDREKRIDRHRDLPKYPGLVYYFGIRFPSQEKYVIGNLKVWLILTSVSLLILLFFVYVIFVVLRQKRLSEMQRDFVNNMTHEFKTPLTASKIALDYMRKSEAIGRDERLSKYCEMISAQTEHLNQQIERILQISLSEKKSFIIHYEEVDLPALLEKISETFMNSHREFILNFREKELMVKADRIHLTSVLYSLIDNAVKYSHENSVIEISLEKPGKETVLSVRDQGVGMDGQYLKKVFRKFYRIPTGNVHNVKGFGLGLYYVKLVIDRHRWKIRLKSKPGEGTEVCIFIPKS